MDQRYYRDNFYAKVAYEKFWLHGKAAPEKGHEELPCDSVDWSSVRKNFQGRDIDFLKFVIRVNPYDRVTLQKAFEQSLSKHVIFDLLKNFQLKKGWLYPEGIDDLHCEHTGYSWRGLQVLCKQKWKCTFQEIFEEYNIKASRDRKTQRDIPKTEDTSKIRASLLYRVAFNIFNSQTIKRSPKLSDIQKQFRKYGLTINQSVLKQLNETLVGASPSFNGKTCRDFYLNTGLLISGPRRSTQYNDAALNPDLMFLNEPAHLYCEHCPP